MVSVEWDEPKRKVNIRKHGIDFVDAKSIFDGLTSQSRIRVLTMVRLVTLRLVFSKDMSLL